MIIYAEKAYCHCGKGSAPMRHSGEGVYACSGCDYKVRFLLEEAPPEWYEAEVMEGPEFPVCLDCGRNMKGCGVTLIEEEERSFEVIGLVCKANEIHPKRRIGSYGREISRDKYAAAQRGAKETLIDWAIEGRLLGLEIPEKVSTDEAMKVVLDILLRTPPIRADGLREVDMTGLSDGEKRMITEACEWYANNGLFHDYIVRDARVSFRPDKRLSNALAHIRVQSGEA